MAAYHDDEFTVASDTVLSSHTPTTAGSAYTQHPQHTAQVARALAASDSMSADNETSAYTIYLAQAAPGGAVDVDFEFTLDIGQSNDSRRVGIVLHYDPTASTGYQLILQPSLTRDLVLYRVVNGVETKIADANVDSNVATGVVCVGNIRVVSGNVEITVSSWKGGAAPNWENATTDVTLPGSGKVVDAHADRIATAGRQGIVTRTVDNLMTALSFEVPGGSNTPPTHDGSDIADKTLTQGVAATPDNVAGRFSDPGDTLTFSVSPLSAAFPAGYTVTSAGVLQGTPTATGTFNGLIVRATDTASQWVDSLPFNVVVGAPSSDTVSVTEPADGRVFQRIGTGKVVAFSGAYTAATANNVQARVVNAGTSVEVVGWTTIATGLSGGTWAGNLTVPIGGFYNIQVRLRDAGNAVLATDDGTNKWAVGYVYAFMGASNMDRLFSQSSSPPALTIDNVRTRDVDSTTWETVTGNGIRALANEFGANIDTPAPIGILRTFRSGSTLMNQWSSRSGGSAFTEMVSLVGTLTGGDLEGAYWQATPNDETAPESEATLTAALLDLCNDFRAAVTNRSDKPVLPFVVGVGPRRYNANMTDEEAQTGRNTVAKWPLQTTQAYSTFWGYDLVNVDSTHLTPASYETAGKRVARTLLFIRDGNPEHRPATIIGWSRSGDTVTVNLAHGAGTDIAPSSGITGFEFNDNGSVIATTAAVRTNATTVTLTLASVPSGAGTQELRFAYGSDLQLGETTNPGGLANLLRDNSANTLPVQSFVGTEGGPTVTITDAGDELYNNGESVVITGTGFGAAQGSGKVYLSPSDNVADAGRVEQTVVSWAATSIQITVVRGSLSVLVPVYLFVVEGGDDSNSPGYQVMLEPRVYVRETLRNLSGTALVNQVGLTALVWRSLPSGAGTPSQVLSGLTTDGNGLTNWQIQRGAMALNDPVWLSVFKDGVPARATMRKIVPVYE